MPDGEKAAGLLVLLKQVRQLGDVACNAPSLIHGQHLGCVSIGFCLAPINKHLIAAWNLLNGPWCWGAPQSVLNTYLQR